MRRSTIFEFLNSRADITGQKIRLRPRKLEDASREYKWRTDRELSLLDASVPIDLAYPDFAERYSIELEYPGLTYTLAVDTLDGQHIGNCSIFNFDFISGNAEVGLIIGNKAYWGQGYGSDAMRTFVQYVFRVSDLSTILLRTLDWNKRAQACFKKCGFIPIGNMTKENYNFIVMELKRSIKQPEG